MTNKIMRLVKELPKEGDLIKSVIIEYGGKQFRVFSEAGICGLQDGIEEGYLLEDLETALTNPGNCENFSIKLLKE